MPKLSFLTTLIGDSAPRGHFLKTFDFIGPVTCYHLGKNIGLEVVKPDRHLVSIAQAAGFPTPRDLCEVISKITGDKITVVDLILWRYATLHTNYMSTFGSVSPITDGDVYGGTCQNVKQKLARSA